MKDVKSGPPFPSWNQRLSHLHLLQLQVAAAEIDVLHEVMAQALQPRGDFGQVGVEEHGQVQQVPALGHALGKVTAAAKGNILSLKRPQTSKQHGKTRVGLMI